MTDSLVFCQTCGTQMAETIEERIGNINFQDLPITVVIDKCPNPNCGRQDANVILSKPIEVKGGSVKQG